MDDFVKIEGVLRGVDKELKEKWRVSRCCLDVFEMILPLVSIVCTGDPRSRWGEDKGTCDNRRGVHVHWLMVVVADRLGEGRWIFNSDRRSHIDCLAIVKFSPLD